MDCLEAARHIELFVLDGLDEPTRESVRAHLATCPACREAERMRRGIVEEIWDAGRAASARPRLTQEVQLTVGRAIAGQKMRGRVLGAAAGVAAAAAMLLAGVGLWVFMNRPAGRAAAQRQVAPAPPAERWRLGGAQAMPTSVADGVVVRGKTMYFVTREDGGGHVSAVDAESGSARWCSEEATLGYVAADETRVYCLVPGAGGPGGLAALDAADGRMVWRYESAAPARRGFLGACAPVVLPDSRVCWTDSGGVVMLDAVTGRRIWRRTIESEGTLSTAGLGREGLYVASGSVLHCLDAGTGEPMWQKDLGAENLGAGRPLVAADGGSQVFVVRPCLAGTSELICVDAEGRQVAWRREVPRAQRLLAEGNMVYLRGNRVEGRDRGNGQVVWSFQAGGCGPMTLAGGLVHFVDSGAQPRLVALNAATGRAAWEIAGIRSCDAFVRRGDTGYIKTRDGVIHALALRP